LNVIQVPRPMTGSRSTVAGIARMIGLRSSALAACGSAGAAAAAASDPRKRRRPIRRDFNTVLICVIDGLDNYKSMAEQVMESEKVKQEFAKVILDVV